MVKVKLATALLRRKELQGKVDQLSRVQKEGLFEVKVTRRAVHEGIDDIIAEVPKITMSQVTAAYDWHAKRLRLVDAAIQHANWTTEIVVDTDIMADYEG